MSGVGTTRVELRNKELLSTIKSIEETKVEPSLELQFLMTISAQLNTIIGLLGDLINEVAPIKYQDDGP